MRLTVARAAGASALLALAVYANAPGNGFALDDVVIVERNASIRTLAAVPSLFTTGYWPEDPSLALYRPLTTASFALDWVVSGGSPAWFHLVNVLLHAAATGLAALLIGRLFGVVAALAGGLVFAVHPAHVEAVANVVGRAEILAALAVFGAALAWLGLRGRPRIGATAALFAAGLFAKESVIALPLLLVLVDAAAGRLAWRGTRAYLRQHAAAAGVLLLVALAYLFVRAAVLGHVAPARIDPALEAAAGPVGRVLTALQAWPHYLRLLLYPRVLLADYGPPIIMPAPPLTPAVWLGLVIVAALPLFAALAYRAGQGGAVLLLLWAPVALLPVSSLVVPIGVVVAERLLYVPSLAVAAAAGILMDRALAPPAAAARALAIAAFAGALALAGARTWARTPDWQSTDHVFAAQLAARPDNFRAQWHRARSLRAAGDAAAALDGYRLALGLWPFRQGLVREAAAFEAEHGDAGRARGLARFGVERWPDDIELQRLLAGTSLQLGDTAAARAALRAGLTLDPADAGLRKLADALAGAGSR